MEFLESKLGLMTGFKLEIIPILDFIDQLSFNASQDSKYRVNEFKGRWINEHYVETLILGYISGSWRPTSVACSDEIFSQRPWNNYLQSLSFQFASGQQNQNQSSALNLDIEHEFWKDAYNCCGAKIISFIVEKTLIISTVINNGFYLLIGSEKNTLYQKALQFRQYLRRVQPQVATLKFKDFNPYKSTLLEEPIKSRKRKLPMNDEVLHNDHLCKKARISEDSKSNNSASDSDSTKTNLNPDTSSKVNGGGLLRWLKLKNSSKTLTDLIKEREQEKAKYSLQLAQSSNQSASEHNPDEINYLGIYHDETFPKMAGGNLKSVLKQSKRMRFGVNPSSIPLQWEGLKIEPPEKCFNQDKLWSVHVYKVSETFARNHDIRIKVKKRRKKTSKDCESLADFIKDDEIANENGLSTLTEEMDFEVSKSAVAVPLRISNAIKPFDPLLMLETSPLLYYKSSWSLWPKQHILKLATNSDSPDDGINLLLNSILCTQVGSNFDEEVLKISSEPEMKLLLNGLKSLLEFHTQVKNIHPFVKQCLKGWILKHDDKIHAKKCRQALRIAWKANHPKMLIRNNTQNRSLNKSSSSIEMIDLTIDTPSTNNPNSDQDPSVLNLSPICDFSILHDTSLKNNSILYGNISNIMNESLISKRKRRGLTLTKLNKIIPSSCVMNTLKQIFYESHMNYIIGSKKNVRGFFKFVRKSIVLAGTKSSLQLGQLMSLVSPLECEWLKPVTDIGIQTAFFAKVMKWIFTNYLQTILKHSFYITENSNSRLHSCFYLRDTWKSINEKQRNHLLKSGHLHYIGPLDSGLKTHISINARMRFIPKKNLQLRPIISRRREKRDIMNEKIGNYFLNYIVQSRYLYRFRDPEILRTRWQKFVEEWRSMKSPKLYYAKVDIKNAYPSIKIDKLTLILDQLLSTVDRLEFKDIKVISYSRTSDRTIVTAEDESISWESKVLSRPCIVMMQSSKSRIQPNIRYVMNKLIKNLQDSKIKIGKHSYNFNYGLPQGSVLSEGLCNLYYGDLDSNFLSDFINRRGEFFSTSVDDYIYISPKPHRVAQFLQIMEGGFSEYNSTVNKAKSLTNIYPRSDISTPEYECEWLYFCGCSFCLSCCHVMRDFSNYAGQDMASTLSFIPRSTTSPESFLLTRMKVMLPAKMNRYLLDPNLNCKGRIVLSIHEAGLIFAFRFVAICRVIYPNLTSLCESDRANQAALAISSCAKTLARLVMRFLEPFNQNLIQAKCMGAGENDLCQCLKSYYSAYFPNTDARKLIIKINEVNNNLCGLKTPEILYVIYHSFILKLKKHSSVFKEAVLPKLYNMRKNQKTLLSDDEKKYLDLLLSIKMPKHFESIKI